MWRLQLDNDTTLACLWFLTSPLWRALDSQHLYCQHSIILLIFLYYLSHLVLGMLSHNVTIHTSTISCYNILYSSQQPESALPTINLLPKPISISMQSQCNPNAIHKTSSCKRAGFRSGNSRAWCSCS